MHGLWINLKDKKMELTIEKNFAKQDELTIFPAIAPLAAFAAKTIATGALTSLGGKALDKVIDMTFPKSTPSATLAENRNFVSNTINTLSVGDIDEALDLQSMQKLEKEINSALEVFIGLLKDKDYEEAKKNLINTITLTTELKGWLEDHIENRIYATCVASLYTCTSQCGFMGMLLRKESAEHFPKMTLLQLLSGSKEFLNSEMLANQIKEQLEESFSDWAEAGFTAHGIGRLNHSAKLAIYTDAVQPVLSPELKLETENYLKELNKNAFLPMVLQTDVIQQWDMIIDVLDSEDNVVNGIAIASAMVNPVGRDKGKEWVSIINLSNQVIDLVGWEIRDSKGHVRRIKSEDQQNPVQPGESFIVRNLSPLRLNNDKDSIFLVNKEGLEQARASYQLPPSKAPGSILSFVRHNH